MSTVMPKPPAGCCRWYKALLDRFGHVNEGELDTEVRHLVIGLTSLAIYRGRDPSDSVVGGLGHSGGDDHDLPGGGDLLGGDFSAHPWHGDGSGDPARDPAR